MIKHLLFIFSFLFISKGYSQGTFTISGTVRNSQTKEPVDSSIFIKVLIEPYQICKTTVDKEGKYKFTLPDSLVGKKLIISYDQDETKIRKEHTDGPCPGDCIISSIYGPDNYPKRLTVNMVSIKDYVFDFNCSPIYGCGELPIIFFKKNGLQPVTLPIDASSGTAICDVFYFLRCNKIWGMEIAGHCSPAEKDKQNLSLKRAQFIKDTLIKLGITPERLVAKGYGDTRPVEFTKESGTIIEHKYEEKQCVTYSGIRRDIKQEMLQTFTLSGTIINSTTHKPVDNSIAVKIFLETTQLYQTYTDDDGKYRFILPDSLTAKELQLRFEQEETRVKKEHINGPCPTNCIINDLYLSNTEKLIIYLDSTHNYTFDSFVTPRQRCNEYSPTIYFKKNELLPVKIDKYDSSDSAICEIFQALRCNRKIVVEISAHCSKGEKNKEELSFKRAQFIKDTLVKLGINPARLVTKWYSDKRPVELKDSNGLVLPGKAKDEENQRVILLAIRRDFKE